MKPDMSFEWDSRPDATEHLAEEMYAAVGRRLPDLTIGEDRTRPGEQHGAVRIVARQDHRKIFTFHLGLQRRARAMGRAHEGSAALGQGRGRSWFVRVQSPPGAFSGVRGSEGG
jgi:hypothetical protein